MKFGTFAATTLLTIAALGVTAGTVHADPAPVTTESTESTEQLRTEGVDKGVGYKTTVDRETGTITTSVEAGRFELASDGERAVLKADNGEVVAEVPLTYEISGSKVSVAHEISDDGHELELTPTATAAEIGEMREVGSMAQLTNELQENVVGVAVGAVLGGLLGALIGLGFLSIITGPIGLLVGAVAGGYVMGGQPFLDAVMAVLRGEP
ncbi:hypothetical protein [Nocardia paucivorans]|uniref:hypothetical protein n=1 Tax=Nocardia paucivorans TaxID=114259 RepID=UPI0002DABC5C|nr:hypothetical protein [Nocardia paucivorans]